MMSEADRPFPKNKEKSKEQRKEQSPKNKELWARSEGVARQKGVDRPKASIDKKRR
jgi:hypothetical protein